MNTIKQIATKNGYSTKLILFQKETSKLINLVHIYFSNLSKKKISKTLSKSVTNIIIIIFLNSLM